MTDRRQLANAIRALSMDAVQKANSGHPGAPMGMADIAEVLWRDHLRHDPNDPNWPNRDRFILSNGHGSMLLYSLLHLSGYDLNIDELKQFRQLHSRTPGHPEYGYAPGVETTTGPLGQGLANGVGMALAEQILAAQFNRDEHQVVDHRTYVFAGDGCLMEGISHEVCSLAGTLGLGKLIVFYDDNGISIDGEVEGWFTDDTNQRFESYNWQVIGPIDGHDAGAIDAAILEAQGDTARPTLIRCKTRIGFGSPNKEGKEESHGAPLGDDEIALTRAALGWEHGPFEIPADIYEAWDAKDKGESLHGAWAEAMAEYRKAHLELSEELDRRLSGDLSVDIEAAALEYAQELQNEGPKVATRKASQMSLDRFGPIVPELLGGSADLAGSNLTLWKGSESVAAGQPGGNYIHYGVREFGMAAMMNGIALHGGFLPYGGTFLIFMEYMRNAVRMAALMKQRVVHVLTHDSIGLGEDGPTHQPIEQIASLRGTPNCDLWRPADAVETAVAWGSAIAREDGPTCLALSRQGLPTLARADVSGIAKGGYVLVDTEGEPDVIVIATGSEVELAVQAAERASAQVRVVSMPCTEAFERQSVEYRESVLPSDITARVAIEAAHRDYWYKYVGLDGEIIGMDSFGESAPAGQLFEHFGITVDALLDAIERLNEPFDDE